VTQRTQRVTQRDDREPSSRWFDFGLAKQLEMLSLRTVERSNCCRMKGSLGKGIGRRVAWANSIDIGRACGGGKAMRGWNTEETLRQTLILVMELRLDSVTDLP
jgi:hypothetical protein